MDVEFLEVTETSARLIIRGITPGQANAIRRTMIRDVPKMAIHFVDFHHGPTQEGKESTSALFDEMVAHRLGLVPVPTDLALFGFHEDCSCDGEGCPNCSITYSLNKSGPAVVYSGDLVPIGSKDFRIKDDAIPLTKLKEDQALLIYAKAILGTGKRHAKWQAVTAAGYRFMANLVLDSKACNSCNKCVEACPRNILSLKKKGPVIDKLEECIACKACVEACDRDAIKIVHDPTTFIFKFETDGALSAKDVLEKSLDIIGDGYANIAEQIAELK